MSKSFFPAVAAAIALSLGGVAVSLPASAAEPTNTVSPGNAKALKAVSDLATQKNWPQVVAKSEEFLASGGNKTAYDKYAAYQFLTMAHAATNNYPELAKALKGQLDSGALPAADQGKIINALVTVAYTSKNFDQAIEYGQQSIRNGTADANIYTVIGQSYFQQNKHNDAVKFLSGLVADQEKRGQAPREQVLQLLRASYEKLDNKQGSIETLEKLVLHYSKPDYWNALLYTVRRDPKLNERQTLQVYRLMQSTNTLKQASDYLEFADLASNAGMPGEAQRVLEAGIAANAFTQAQDKSRAERLMASAKKYADSDKAGLAKREAEAKATPGGDLDVAYGMSQYGHGDYPKAVEALSRGIGKGNLRNPVDAQVTLAIAQVRANDKAAALKTLNSIKTDDALWNRVGNLWELYVR